MHYFKPLSRRKMALWCAALTLGLALCGAVRGVSAWLGAGRELCEDTLRLHIRAGSDTVRDQTIKLIVRDKLLAFAAASAPADKAEALAWAARSLPDIQLDAQCALAKFGGGEVNARLVNMYFDTAHYSGGSLPAGRYDAVRIDLGAEQSCGKNWWCVLYPGLCQASACGGYAMPEENDLVCGDYILRFSFVDWWQRHKSPRADSVLLAL